MDLRNRHPGRPGLNRPARWLALAAALPVLGPLPPAGAADVDPPPPIESKPGDFVFSLMPRAFQKDPKIELAVITEMTEAGRKVRVPTADRPIYYLPVPGGYHDEGQNVVVERPFSVEELQRRLERSLHASHYLAAAAGRPTECVLVFAWGSANRLDPGTPDIDHRNLLARAALVGGERFAHDYAKALLLQDDLVAGGARIHPTPVEVFMDREAKNLQLVEQSKADCFYVVVSAYDHAAFAHGRRELLWRTKITANTDGVSMEQTLPTLIVSGAGYFGRDMKEPATLRGRLVPTGTVTVGTPTVVPPPGSPPSQR